MSRGKWAFVLTVGIVLAAVDVAYGAGRAKVSPPEVIRPQLELSDVEFPDVPADHWAYAEIAACFVAGIVSGYPDEFYRPKWPLSRDAMAVFISRALSGGDTNVPDGPSTAFFDDAPIDHWAYKYIQYCARRAIVQGFDSVTYGPEVTVSRDAMAVFVARAHISASGSNANVPEGPALPTFDDVPADQWAFKYIEHCAAEGIVQGYGPATYGPTDTVSRDQMAVFIARAFESE